MSVFNFELFYQHIAGTPLSHWLESLPKQISLWKKELQPEQVKQWFDAVNKLPELADICVQIKDEVSAKTKNSLSAGQYSCLEHYLKQLAPWRKGPYSLHGVHIDTEWRSDWKWQRVMQHISPLTGKIVLDVGCGNGYHLWRMVGAGAKLAIGIDPMTLFLCQFEAVRKLLGNIPSAYLLPLTLEKMQPLGTFDTVFSMGVLYHRRSPLDHLHQLKEQLTHQGELILETLITEGDAKTVLMPTGRYAQMRNVYFIPSALALQNWLLKCGFVDVRIADITTTTIEEQRNTAWMSTNSLREFLDPHDRNKTIEGYPAPQRAIILAKKP